VKRAALWLAAVAVAFPAGAMPSDSNWANYGHGPGGMRYSPLTQITPANVAGLKLAWTYHMRPSDAEPVVGLDVPEAKGRPGRGRFAASEATPLVVDGVMYLPTPYGRVVALNADTGHEIWTYKMEGRDRPSMRGVAYWPGDGKAAAEIVFGTRSGKLIALDAATGQPVAGFGTNGVVDMKTPEVMNGSHAPFGMSSPPMIYRNLVITGSRVQEMPSLGAAGDVRAWDARTGKLVWTFHTVPRPGEVGHETWGGDSWKNRSGVNSWTFLVLDEKRGILYMPLGAPTFDRWGGDRPGKNLFSDSIVAVDAATGKYLWHFQTVHHDIWDLDLPTATLIEVRRDGRTIPAIAVMNKTAIMFILDRVTGKPLYDVKEVPVPTDTDIPGEQPWPTQPMPVAPPPLTRLSFAMSDLNRMTPEIAAKCEQMVKDMNIVESKPFQPLRADSAVAFFPGSLGGLDWGGGAFDKKRGLYIVNVNALASPQQLVQQPDGSWNLKDGYVYFWDRATRIPCQKPPWGELVAVNVDNGTIAWRRTLGQTDSLPEGMRDTGRLSAGGPIVTASGLTFIGATDDNHFRAFDTGTGKLLWDTTLPASIYGTPLTYRGKSGRQFVAAVDTGGFAGSPVTNDEVMAFSLPDQSRGQHELEK
jgi:quinoprotein glucose dehydrogenase